MLISCTYDRPLYRDEYTGETLFLVKPDDPSISKSPYGTLRIWGRIQPLPKQTPLWLETEEESEQEMSAPKPLKMKGYALKGTPDAQMKQFLSSRLFRDVGKAAAEKLSSLGMDLFEASQSEDAMQKLTSTGLSAQQVETILAKVREMEAVYRLCAWLFQYGCSYADIRRIYRRFGSATEKTLREHPYRLCEAGVPFAVCEHIAGRDGNNRFPKERLRALLLEAIRQAEEEGHTRITWPLFRMQCEKTERSANLGRKTSDFYLAAGLAMAGISVKHEDGQYYLYRNKTWEEEATVATHVFRLCHTNYHTTIPQHIIDSVMQACGITFSQSQKEAFRLLTSPGVKILTGGPGTGKTTLVNGLIMAYELVNPGKCITLCAPTGCASKRLQEATGRSSSTIHRLLDIRPYETGWLQGKNETNHLTADFLIVDECSMIDSDLFLMLIRAVKTGAIVLLVGDEDQLPPVGKGRILHDLLRCRQIESCRLTEVFRQQEGSSIIENSIRIRNGNADLKIMEDYRILRCENETEMKEKLTGLLKACYDPKAPFASRVFTTVRKPDYAMSTARINAAMAERTCRKDTPYFHYRQNRFHEGMPVLFNRNNYAKGYYNGDTGIIQKIVRTEDGILVRIRTEDDEMELMGESLDDIEPAYAMTTHKSQGGECDTAIVILPLSPSNMLSRKLLYVAATRARRRTVILTEKDALEIALSNDRQAERMTGLTARLRDVFTESYPPAAGQTGRSARDSGNNGSW